MKCAWNRIENLEKNFMEKVGYQVPGTIISRVLDKKEGGGYGWCIGFGPMDLPKLFFYGKTIEKALEQAEEIIDTKFPS